MRLLVIFLLFGCIACTRNDVTSLLCEKKWRWNYYVLNDSVQKVSVGALKDQTPVSIFYRDGRYVNSLNPKDDSYWKYDAARKKLIITTPYMREKLRLVRLTKDTLETMKDENGSPILGFTND
jgi:hypothetical protein